MNRKDRKEIGKHIRFELSGGLHTFTMCKCGRHGNRTGKCWECWLEILENGKDFAIYGEEGK